MRLRSSARSFGGEVRFYEHDSQPTGTPMRFSVFVPEGKGPFPGLLWLSGLTCTEENFMVKSGAQAHLARAGMICIAPDTSPRGEGVPDDPEGAWDFGLGAGFYVDATQAPWSKNYQMYSYVTEELYDLVMKEFPVSGLGISGHSMGGHGALVCGLRNPEKFQSISALAPISAPSQCPWGKKAFENYLGSDGWENYDATELVKKHSRKDLILIDQGSKDDFYLQKQLQPEVFEAAAQAAGQPVELRMHEGYDHGYYFVASFMEDHVRHHLPR